MFARLVSWALEGDPVDAQFKPFRTFTGRTEAEAIAGVSSFVKTLSIQPEWFDVMWEIRTVSADSNA